MQCLISCRSVLLLHPAPAASRLATSQHIDTLAQMNDMCTSPLTHATLCTLRTSATPSSSWLCTLLVLAAHVTAAPPCISMSHSTCLSSARMRDLGPLAFGLYRTLHFAVDTTLRTRTICYERVKATSLRLLLISSAYGPDQLCSHRSNSITHITRIIRKYYSVRFLCLQCCAKTK